MSDVQHIIDSVHSGNESMAAVLQYGVEIGSDLQGTANLADVAASIGGALGRVEGVMGFEGLPMTYGAATRANEEAANAELAYLAAGCSGSSNQDARDAAQVSHHIEEVANATVEEVWAMRDDLTTALTGLRVVHEALAAYEARRVVLASAAKRGMVEAPQVVITAGNNYLATLASESSAT